MDIAALVALAGNTLVTAAVTDAWEDVSGKVARLFGRGEPDLGTERRFDATREQLAAAAPADLQRVQADQASRWAGRLADLLDEYPDAEAQLRALVDDIRTMLPTVSASDRSLAAGGNINIIATNGGIAAGSIHGNVGPPNPPMPGPASG
jgi:hypothetical protein